MNIIYKRSFAKTLSFFTVLGLLIFILSLAVICVYILLPLLHTFDLAHLAAFAIMLPFLLALWYYVYIGMYFYIILDEDKITVQNYFLPFIRIRRCYKDIGNIKFWLPVPSNWNVNAVEIVRKGKRRGALFLGIIMVDPKDYAQIVSTLQSKGVTVETYNNLSHKEYVEVCRKIKKG